MLDVWKKLKDKCNYFSQNFFLMKHHRHRLKSTYKKCFHCLRFSRILTQLLNFSQTLTLVTMPLCLKFMHVKLHTCTRYINTILTAIILRTSKEITGYFSILYIKYYLLKRQLMKIFLCLLKKFAIIPRTTINFKMLLQTFRFVKNFEPNFCDRYFLP